MHQQLDEAARRVERGAVGQLLNSTNPATGELVWSGETGDAAAEVAAARAAWPGWAAHSTSFRVESLRRFANVVRAKEAEFAEIISKETGKPLWEAKTEVGAVVNKVEISIDAYAERTPQRKLEAALGNKIAIRHKPVAKSWLFAASPTITGPTVPPRFPVILIKPIAEAAAPEPRNSVGIAQNVGMFV